MAVKLVLNPIFSPCAIDSSVVPVFEHLSLKFWKSGFFSKCLDRGWSTDRAKKEKPNKVSGLVVKHLTSFTGKLPSISKLMEIIGKNFSLKKLNQNW